MDGVHLKCWPLFYINQPLIFHIFLCKTPFPSQTQCQIYRLDLWWSILNLIDTCVHVYFREHTWFQNDSFVCITWDWSVAVSQSTERRRVSKSSHQPNPSEFLFPSIKFYWNTAMPFHLHIVYGYFGPVRVELTSCSRDCPTKSIYDLALYRNCWPLASMFKFKPQGQHFPSCLWLVFQASLWPAAKACYSEPLWITHSLHTSVLPVLPVWGSSLPPSQPQGLCHPLSCWRLTFVHSNCTSIPAFQYCSELQSSSIACFLYVWILSPQSEWKSPEGLVHLPQSQVQTLACSRCSVRVKKQSAMMHVSRTEDLLE